MDTWLMCNAKWKIIVAFLYLIALSNDLNDQVSKN